MDWIGGTQTWVEQFLTGLPIAAHVLGPGAYSAAPAPDPFVSLAGPLGSEAQGVLERPKGASGRGQSLRTEAKEQGKKGWLNGPLLGGSGVQQ